MVVTGWQLDFVILVVFSKDNMMSTKTKSKLYKIKAQMHSELSAKFLNNTHNIESSLFWVEWDKAAGKSHNNNWHWVSERADGRWIFVLSPVDQCRRNQWHRYSSHGHRHVHLTLQWTKRCVCCPSVSLFVEGSQVALVESNIAHTVHHWTSVVPSAHPDPPEEPKVLHTSSHSVTLSWYKPLSDGGCDILGYQVERKIPGVGWQSCNKSIIQSMEFVVDNLTPGEPYRFRVSAVNKVGASEPAQFPQMVQLGEKGKMAPWRTASCCRPVSHGMSASSVPGISWKSSISSIFQCFAASTIQENELGQIVLGCHKAKPAVLLLSKTSSKLHQAVLWPALHPCVVQSPRVSFLVELRWNESEGACWDVFG